MDILVLYQVKYAKVINTDILLYDIINRKYFGIHKGVLRFTVLLRGFPNSILGNNMPPDGNKRPVFYSSSLVTSTSGDAAEASSGSTTAEPAFARTFESVAAIPELMRPSSASLRAKREISASYSSHSGI